MEYKRPDPKTRVGTAPAVVFVDFGILLEGAEGPVAAPWPLRHVGQSYLNANLVLACFGRLAGNRRRGRVHLDRPHLMVMHVMIAYCGRPTPDKTTFDTRLRWIEGCWCVMVFVYVCLCMCMYVCMEGGREGGVWGLMGFDAWQRVGMGPAQ